MECGYYPSCHRIKIGLKLRDFILPYNWYAHSVIATAEIPRGIRQDLQTLDGATDREIGAEHRWRYNYQQPDKGQADQANIHWDYLESRSPGEVKEQQIHDDEKETRAYP